MFLFQKPYKFLPLSIAGLFKSRSSGESNRLSWENGDRQARKHTSETKAKLSEIRIKYLAENPDKPAWKTKDKFKSIPCEKVKDELKLLNIPFTPEFMPLLHKKRFFSADITFLDKKIMIEINGNQHFQSDGNLKPYYQNRHDLIEAEGWKIYEVPYHVAMRKGFVKDFVIPIFNGVKPVYDLTLYQRAT